VDRAGGQGECRLASGAVRERYANALLSDQVDAIVLAGVAETMLDAIQRGDAKAKSACGAARNVRGVLIHEH
jgi:hypothetical protein